MNSQVDSAQIERMRAAITRAVALGPRFLQGDVDADQMARTMVDAVQGYVQQEQDAGLDGLPRSAPAQPLFEVLRELMGCGSGFLAGRCDGACVARTMTEMLRSFPPSSGTAG